MFDLFTFLLLVNRLLVQKKTINNHSPYLIRTGVSFQVVLDKCKSFLSRLISLLEFSEEPGIA